MDRHTSFRVGGPADLYLRPADEEDLKTVIYRSQEYGLPLFPLGDGANILVSDKGIRGIVLDMGNFTAVHIEGSELYAGAGLAAGDAAEKAAAASLGGMDFLYAMPGSIGGSVWMNARCYGKSVSDILRYTDVIDSDGTKKRIRTDVSQFAYKRSPFQNRRSVIVGAGFSLQKEDPAVIRERMRNNEADRRQKGHFSHPSAGSVFKNNRRFGSPTGLIIDSLGLKGMRIGGAQISELHGNIIVNTGSARAEDIRELIEAVEKRVQKELGLLLEREVLLVGEW
jgi:UDP-N-acetylmuramate dehydrogenase